MQSFWSRITFSVIILGLAGCSGGGSDSASTDTPPALAVEDSPSQTQAARFLTMATFGPTQEDIDELTTIGYSAWFQRQFSYPIDRYLPRMQPLDGAANDSTTALRTAPLFWENAIGGEDQLRQRAAFALSEIMVASVFDNGAIRNRGHMIATYMDTMQEGAFGNLRDTLEAVTYNPVMGIYLTYLGNQGVDPDNLGIVPDENYARELMQLFTVGLLELNRDGTVRTANGAPIEIYDNGDITELAKVFTGLYWEGMNFRQRFANPTEEIEQRPMEMNDDFHSPESKSFLGLTIPAGASGAESIDMALDHLFQHPNHAPFISKQLIQRFVTSNPSPEYVERVVSVFESGRFTLPNGSVIGDTRRGDLRPVLAAILLDAEALDPASAEDPTFGKVREPIIRFTHWARAYGIAPSFIRHYILENTSGPNRLNQQAFRSPSVFNFFRPGYVAPGSQTGEAGLVAPELQIAGASSYVGYVNFMTDFVTRSEPQDTLYIPDYSDELALLNDPEALAERINLELMAGRMRPETRQRIFESLDTLTNANTQDLIPIWQVRLAVLLAVTSPEFIVQR